MKRRHISTSLVGLGLVSVIGWSAWAGEGRISVFERLENVQVERELANQEARRLDAQLESMDDAISSASERAEVANRAAAPIQAEIQDALVSWVGLFREVAYLSVSVGERRDTRNLIRFASREAIEPRLRDVEVLRRLSHEQLAVDRKIERRVQATVQMAQHRATAETRGKEREAILRDAGADPHVEDDLAESDEKLHRSLSHLLKNESTLDFHRLKGTLIPPSQAPIVARYGPRAHGATKTSTRHTGLTYEAPLGSGVKATAEGLVVYAHRFEGYGKLVLVDHGGGYHSLYAHLSSIDVELGARVRRGQIIGRSGETGSLEGPKLYFELRKDGQAIDPAPWFLRTE